MEIRDPIHGNIELNRTEEDIISTPEMQRLNYIKQLDLSYLVFPGAHHTRFEHSLGTMQVAKKIFSGALEKEDPEFSYVGLLHDIGHGPFSHLSEPYIEKYLGKNHEQLGVERIKNSEIKDIISAAGMSLDKVLSYFRGSEKIDVVGGALGADRIDYLMRDSHYTGVAYGVIDFDRLKVKMTIYEGKVAIFEGGISGAESMLIARYFMYSNIYMHHAKIIATQMLRSAIGLALEEGTFDAAQMAQMNDERLLMRIQDSTNRPARELVKKILERKLYKRVYEGKIGKDIDEKEIANSIMKAGFSSDEFIVRILKMTGGEEDLMVVDAEGLKIGKLSKISPFVGTLATTLKDSKKLIVACDKKNIEKIHTVVRKFV